MAIKQVIKSPTDSLGDYTLLIAGEKKVGKTALCSQFPNHFIFEFEVGNAKHLNCTYEDISSLKIFNEILKEAETTKWFGTVICDEIAVLYDMCADSVCKKEGVSHLSDLEWGKGWSLANKAFEGYLRRIQGLTGGNIYTAHTEMKTIKTRNKQDISKMETSLSGAAQKIMDRMTHFWGVITFGDNSIRTMQIEGDDLIKAGHGFKKTHFLKVKDAKIPMGNSPEKAYENFINAWNNKSIGVVADQIKLQLKKFAVKRR